MNDVTFTRIGFEEYTYWINQDKKTLKRINLLIQDIQRNGLMNGIGKPEPLKHDRQGLYSRRIDDENRLVYCADELQNIKIISCRGHYDDK